MLDAASVRVVKFAGKFVAVRSVAPDASVSEPPALLRFAANAPRSSVPLVTERFPFSARTPASDAVLFALLTVRLLNVDGVMVCAPLPLSITVLLPGVNVPLFVQLPPSASVIAPTESDAPVPMVTLVATVRLPLSVTAEMLVTNKFPFTAAVAPSVAVPLVLLNTSWL